VPARDALACSATPTRSAPLSHVPGSAIPSIVQVSTSRIALETGNTLLSSMLAFSVGPVVGVGAFASCQGDAGRDPCGKDG